MEIACATYIIFLGRRAKKFLKQNEHKNQSGERASCDSTILLKENKFCTRKFLHLNHFLYNIYLKVCVIKRLIALFFVEFSFIDLQNNFKYVYYIRAALILQLSKI